MKKLTILLFFFTVFIGKSLAQIDLLSGWDFTNGWGKTANTNIAMGFATLVMRQGGIPFIPHLTHFWHLQHPRDWEEWLVYDSYWLAHCDCLVRIEGESRGADAECTLAQEMGLRIITEEEVINGFDFTRIFA